MGAKRYKEQKEIAVVSASYAVIYPGAVMVKILQLEKENTKQRCINALMIYKNTQSQINYIYGTHKTITVPQGRNWLEPSKYLYE